MKKTIYSVLFICIASLVVAQSPDAAKRAREFNKQQKAAQQQLETARDLAASITANDLREHLTVLASDEMEGRETGTEGNEKAARYIADQFKAMGLPAIGSDKSYFQPVVFTKTRWEEVGLEVNGKSYRHLWDYISFPNNNNDQPEVKTNEVVFLGFGIEDKKYNDYRGVDVTGKVILIYKGEPVNKKGISKITGSTDLSDWSADLNKKLAVAKKHGVRTVLIIENEIQKLIGKNRRFLVGSETILGEEGLQPVEVANSYIISTTVAKAIMGDQFKKVVKARKKMQKRGKSKPVTLPTDLELTQKKHRSSLIGNNVLGYIEGSDPELKDEIVVLTAHYDHLGKRGDDIYNGADDNGSGTSTILEIAQAFATAKKEGHGPRRSVLAMLVTAEEKGLLGSKYYVEKPLFPIANTVVDINVDMVGRVDEKHQHNPNYIYVIGSNRLSTELHDINEAMNKTHTQLELDYTFNAEDDPNRFYYRSDHYNFAEKGIPSIFYFNGTHADYHRTSDTVEKINFEKMETVGRLIFHTAWEIANRDKRLVVDVKP